MLEVLERAAREQLLGTMAQTDGQSNVDLVLIIGPGVVLGIVAIVVAYLRWRRPRE